MDLQWYHLLALLLSVVFSLYKGNLLSLVVVLIVLLSMLRRWMKGRQNSSTARLDGKLAIVTGANTGLGRETALGLAARGARVILGCRDREKGEAACQYIKERTGSSKVDIGELDLSSFTSVRKFAQMIVDKETKLDILVCNAGVRMVEKTITEDGQELVFQVNHLGHFLLTNLLMGLLKTSDSARVLSVTSTAYSWVKKSGMNLNDTTWTKTAYDKKLAFGQSKLANILFTRELAAKTEGTSVRTFCLHPGIVATDGFRYYEQNLSPVARIFWNIFVVNLVKPLLFKTPAEGAQTTLFCCADESIQEKSGLFYVDCEQKSLENFAKDKALAENLWNISEDIVGDITILGAANIETVKVAEVKETAESKDGDTSSSDSENDEKDQQMLLKTESNELTMKNMMNFEEGNTQSILESNLRTTTANIEMVKVVEVHETAESKDGDTSSSDSENDEKDQQMSLKTESNELTMKNTMNFEEGNTQSILESNLRTTTVTRRIVKTVISSSHVSAAENNVNITEI
eukprot:GFUD01027008.1.p1 GENE.GFUD01027008.1~~GFUD01027008.1.p1  ORF type:complete len:518 (+),score=150.44 GFUD01027008.1:35-1588(+)